MTENDFLSIIARLDRFDYVKAKIIPYKFIDGILKVTSRDQGEQFMVYLIKSDGSGLECVVTMTSYDEARQMVDDLDNWLSEDDWDLTKESFEL
jgi:hypothetical protein